MDTRGTASIAKKGQHTPPSALAADPKVEQTQDTPEQKPELREVNLGVRYFNYCAFINRVRGDNWDHTIECLLTSSKLQDEVDKERKRRKVIEGDENPESVKYPHSDVPLIAENPNKIEDYRHLFRVRIRSFEILRHLAELSEWENDIGPLAREVLVFCRPFHLFVFYHEAMKERLKKMELDQDHNISNESVLDILPAPRTALEEMRCYVAFVEQSILPLWAQYDKFDKNTPKKVCYEDIPMLFRPGELAFVPSSRKANKSYHQSSIQMSFECISAKRCEERLEIGKAFKELAQASGSHFYYSGWNLITGVIEPEDSKTKEPEHMEGEVIIDIKEAERHVPESANRDVPDSTLTGYGFWIEKSKIPYRIWTWRGEERVDIVEHPDYELVREDSAYFEKAKEVNRNASCIQKDGSLTIKWTGEDYALLPRRICGYVLRERKFARLDVQSFQLKADREKITLDDIQINDEHKKIIRSCVSSHFLRSIQSGNEYQVLEPDIIRGKGRGLVILLHGAPGVGKTATAEALALEFNKPLFPITCGDLGVTPEAVEKTLKDIFRYAHLWDCILLLDEADVFLTQRDRINVERNALVSVFLRVLEYYRGILFLTTNRVGALDEAFRSRVHISLYYPHLNYEDTIAILQNNLNRLPRAESQPENATPMSARLQVMDSQIMQYIQSEYNTFYRTHKRGPWNGRQIRNAVQIAACLALFEHKDGPKNLPAVLTAEHFRTVHATMTEFDMYMTKAQRADNSKMAHMAGDRFDSYGEDVESHEPVEYEGFSDFMPGRQYTVPMRSAGRGTAPTSSRVGPTRGQVFREPGPGPSRGRYPDPSYAAGRGYVAYRPSSTYMEEEEETFHKNTFGGQPRAIHFQRSDRRSQLPTNEDMHMGEDLGDQFPDNIEQGQSSEYELRSSEDHHLEVDIIATNNHRNNLVFDQSLGPINNPPSVSGTRMSGSHVSKQPGFQRQGYGS